MSGIKVVPVTLLLLITAACGKGAATNSPEPLASPKAASAASPLATLTPSGETLLEASGTSSSKTKDFATTGLWYLDLRYDCSRSGDYMVADVEGSNSFVVGGITEKSVQGEDMRRFLTRGTFHIEVSTNCAWSISVMG